jgi:hypothetical protein
VTIVARLVALVVTIRGAPGRPGRPGRRPGRHDSPWSPWSPWSPFPVIGPRARAARHREESEPTARERPMIGERALLASPGLPELPELSPKVMPPDPKVGGLSISKGRVSASRSRLRRLRLFLAPLLAVGQRLDTRSTPTTQ